MCGTGTVGQKTFVAPATSNGTNTTQVAGAKGDATQVAGATGGGGTDIAAMLQQITSAIEALRQALTGAGAVVGGGHGDGHGDMKGCDMMGGGAGGESTAVADANGGAEAMGGGHGGHGGMAGCDSMGGGGYTVPVTSTDVADATGGGDKAAYAGSDVAGDAGGAKGKDSAVDGASGAPGKDSAVDGASGAPGKTDVGGVGGDPTQVGQTPVQKLDAAKTDKAAKDEAVTKATADVEAKKGAVTTAEADLATAETKKVDADKALVDAGQALEAAKTGHGSHTTGASDTLASIAAKYGVTEAKLKSLNPEITVLGTLPAGTKVKLPKGVGVEAAVAEATTKLNAARTAAAAAEKAVQDAIAALQAARDALKAAEAAEKAAKEAAEAAAKAVEEAQKAADDAAKAADDAAKAAEAAKVAEAAKAAEAAGTGGDAAPAVEGAGATTPTAEQAPQTRDYVVKAGDSPWKIARQENVDARALAMANPEAFAKGVIHPGQVLKIPVGAAPFDPTSAAAAFKEYWGGSLGAPPAGNGGGTSRRDDTPIDDTPAVPTATEQRVAALREQISGGEAQLRNLREQQTAKIAERTRYQQMLPVGGYVAQTANTELRRIASELSGLSSSINFTGRGVQELKNELARLT